MYTCHCERVPTVAGICDGWVTIAPFAKTKQYYRPSRRWVTVIFRDGARVIFRSVFGRFVYTTKPVVRSTGGRWSSIIGIGCRGWSVGVIEVVRRKYKRKERYVRR